MNVHDKIYLCALDKALMITEDENENQASQRLQYRACVPIFSKFKKLGANLINGPLKFKLIRDQISSENNENFKLIISYTRKDLVEFNSVWNIKICPDGNDTICKLSFMMGKKIIVGSKKSNLENVHFLYVYLTQKMYV